MMKNVWKYLLSAVVTLFFSGCMFYCLVAGAPQGRKELWIYILAAGGFSILLPSFVCVCIHYILYLQKIIESHEKSKEE